MNTYLAIYGSARAEIQAETTYQAQQKAVALFQATTRRRVKGSDIAIGLLALNGEPYTHTAVD